MTSSQNQCHEQFLRIGARKKRKHSRASDDCEGMEEQLQEMKSRVQQLERKLVDTMMEWDETYKKHIPEPYSGADDDFPNTKAGRKMKENARRRSTYQIKKFRRERERDEQELEELRAEIERQVAEMESR